MRRMSPLPRKKPAALANVGAAVNAVAANALKSARRDILVELSFVMWSSPRILPLPVMLHEGAISSPDATWVCHSPDC